MTFRHIDTAEKGMTAGRECALFGVNANGYSALGYKCPGRFEAEAA